MKIQKTSTLSLDNRCNYPAKSTSWLLLIFISSLLSLVLFCILKPVLTCQAHYVDDDQYVTNNPLVQNPGLKSGQIVFQNIFSPSFVQGYYQPLSMISLMLDRAMGGQADDYTVFHQTSLLLHIANTLMVTGLLYCVYRNVWMACLGGLLFGLHPICVESLAWVSDRKTLLSTFWGLCCLLTYLFYLKNRPYSYVLSLFFYFLAMLTKPTVVLLPIILLLLGHTPRFQFDRKRIVNLVPFFLLGAVLVVVAYISQNNTAGIFRDPDGSPYQTPFIFFHDSLFYLFKAFWPVDLPQFYLFPRVFLSSWTLCLGAMLLFCLLSFAVTISIRFTRNIAAGMLFYLTALLPCIQFFRFSEIGAADKYLYFPLIGLVIAILGFTELILKHLNRKAKIIVVLITLGAIGVESNLTRNTLYYWTNTTGLYNNLLSKEPNSALLHNNLGVELRKENCLDLAINHFKEGININPYTFHNWYNLGSSYITLGNYSQALECLKYAVILKTNSAEAYTNLGGIYERQNNPIQALAAYKKAISINPHLYEAGFNLAQLFYKEKNYPSALNQCHQMIHSHPDNPNILFLLGQIYFETGQLDTSLSYLNKTLLRKPCHTEALFLRGRLYLVHKNISSAVLDLSSTIHTDPNHLDARLMLSDIYLKQNESEKALECLLNGLPKNGNDVGLLCRLSVIYATQQNNPTQAIAYAQRACEQSNYSHPGVIDILACSYASSGDITKAIEIENKAVVLARQNGQTELASKFSAKLDSFRKRLDIKIGTNVE